MNLNQLRVFRFVYERSSVSEAARALNLTQPPVTRMLRSFEDEVGFKLFKRGRGQLVPTPEADVLYRQVMIVFDSFEKIEQTTDHLKAGHSEQLSIAASLSLSYAILAPALKRFRARYPNIPIDVSTGTLRDQLYALERGDIELSLTFNAPPAPEIKALTLGEGSFVVILPTGHPLAAKSSVALSDLADCPILSGIRGRPPPDIDEIFEQTKGPLGSANITVRSTVLAAALTSVGLGVALIDEFSATAFPRSDIVTRPLSRPILYEIQALMKSQKRLSTAQKFFLDQIKVEIMSVKDSARAAG